MNGEELFLISYVDDAIVLGRSDLAQAEKAKILGRFVGTDIAVSTEVRDGRTVERVTYLGIDIYRDLVTGRVELSRVWKCWVCGF